MSILTLDLTTPIVSGYIYVDKYYIVCGSAEIIDFKYFLLIVRFFTFGLSF